MGEQIIAPISDKLYIGPDVGLRALHLYVSNDNMNVGMVTERHLIFSELLVQMRSDDERTIEESLKDAVSVFGLCFQNYNTMDKKTGKMTYESPLEKTIYVDNSGFKCVIVSPRLADLVYEEVQIMELNPGNITAACVDLIFLGRMWQELTIDSTKTMYDVCIPYGDDLVHARLLSRYDDEGDYNVVCDWKSLDSEELKNNQDLFAPAQTARKWRRNGHVQYVVNTADSATKIVPRNGKKIQIREVADFQHTIRLGLMAQNIQFANQLMEVRQKLPISIRARITTVLQKKTAKQAREIGYFFHEIYRTITTYQHDRIVDAYKKFEKNSAALEDHVKGIKAEAKNAMCVLTNQLRNVFKSFGLSPDEAISVLLDIVLAAKNNSAYAHQVLEEEFLLWTLKWVPDVSQYTEDKLMYCDIEEDTEVEFMFGRAIAGDKVAFAVKPLEGKFVIRKNDAGKFVASKRISDCITIPTPDADKLIFVTKAGGGRDKYTSTHMKEISERLLEAKDTRVTLVPFIRGDNSVHDAIVIDDTVIGSFRCSYAVDGNPYNSKALTDMYKYKQGIVESVLINKVQSEVGETAVVVLKDIQTVEAPVVKHSLVNEQTTPTATVKPSEQFTAVFKPQYTYRAPKSVPKKTEPVASKPVDGDPFGNTTLSWGAFRARIPKV